MRILKSTIKATFHNFTAVALASTQAQIDAAVAMTTGTAVMTFNAGTAALPGLYPLGSPSTGLWSPAANQLAVSLAGVQVLLMGGTALVTTLGVAAAAFATTGAYSGGTGQLVSIGATMLWWDDVLPTEGGYVWANGQPISRTAYPILFARWGTRFGAGDGSTTFNVPDMRDAVPVGKSTMGGAASRGLQTLTNTVLGALIGAANVVLVTLNLPPYTPAGAIPPHTHNITVSNADGTTAAVRAGDGSPSSIYTVTQPTPTLTFTGTAQGGVSAPVNNVQPSTTVNYIIRAA